MSAGKEAGLYYKEAYLDLVPEIYADYNEGNTDFLGPKAEAEVSRLESIHPLDKMPDEMWIAHKKAQKDAHNAIDTSVLTLEVEVEGILVESLPYMYADALNAVRGQNAGRADDPLNSLRFGLYNIGFSSEDLNEIVSKAQKINKERASQ